MFGFNIPAKLKSILKSALIAGVGGIAAYLLAVLSTGDLDLGIYGPIAAAVLSWVANLVKVYFEKQPTPPPVAKLGLILCIAAAIATSAIGCCPCRRCDAPPATAINR